MEDDTNSSTHLIFIQGGNVKLLFSFDLKPILLLAVNKNERKIIVKFVILLSLKFHIYLLFLWKKYTKPFIRFVIQLAIRIVYCKFDQ